MIAAHVMQMFTPNCDRCWYSVAPYFLLGFSYATYAVVLWASIPYMVEARSLGTAFGMVTLFQNVGTFFAPPLIGYIQDYYKDVNKYPWAKHGYFMVEVFFTVISVLAFFFTLMVWWSDKVKRDAVL